MYTWCSYCQKFLGEFEPKNDYRISHGTCASCRVRIASESETLISQAKPMKEFFSSIRKDLLARKNRNASVLLEQAKALGIAPLDILAGIMQPLLYEIVQLQKVGEATSQQEHDFSVLVDGIFAEIRRIPSGTPRVLLACADGNYHVFGPRLIQEYLFKEGISARCLYPSLPFEDIMAAAEEDSIKVIGISVAAPEQTENVLAHWKEYYRTPSAKDKPTLILGGMGLSCHLKLPANTYAHTGNLNDLKALVQGLLLDKGA